ncbi:MAG: acetyl-CoA carboxylase biotin carboxyl carrier protein [bacterium]|nr:acetyl-CoA carboxylase biotin carboxyl carrier protein [bacterium]
MDLKEIKQLLRLMDEHGLTEFVLERKDAKLSLKRGSATSPGPAAPMAMPAPGVFPIPAVPSSPAAPPAAAGPAAASAPGAAGAAEEEKLVEIKSPMVGTFYAAPSPDSEPYVQPGAHVNPDTTVCIVEAMKIMNEIKAEVSGTIAQVCVKNGQPVEFGQPLFKVRVS